MATQMANPDGDDVVKDASLLMALAGFATGAASQQGTADVPEVRMKVRGIVPLDFIRCVGTYRRISEAITVEEEFAAVARHDVEEHEGAQVRLRASFVLC